LFGAYIIGDEILVGKREDKHLSFLIGALSKRGLRLAWAQYLGDDPQRLTAALARSLAAGESVFSFGGIGATPDDHTRQCAAAALQVPLVLHPDAEREIRTRFAGQELTPQRLQMGEFPRGAAIIPNPVNRIPGFSVGEHHFVPGFPQMAWPMVEWVLDTRYRERFGSGISDEELLLRLTMPEEQVDAMVASPPATERPAEPSRPGRDPLVRLLREVESRKSIGYLRLEKGSDVVVWRRAS